LDEKKEKSADESCEVGQTCATKEDIGEENTDLQLALESLSKGFARIDKSLQATDAKQALFESKILEQCEEISQLKLQLHEYDEKKLLSNDGSEAIIGQCKEAAVLKETKEGTPDIIPPANTAADAVAAATAHTAGAALAEEVGVELNDIELAKLQAGCYQGEDIQALNENGNSRVDAIVGRDASSRPAAATMAKTASARNATMLGLKIAENREKTKVEAKKKKKTAKKKKKTTAEAKAKKKAKAEAKRRKKAKADAKKRKKARADAKRKKKARAKSRKKAKANASAIVKRS